jgi:hypothetical protein
MAVPAFLDPEIAHRYFAPGRSYRSSGPTCHLLNCGRLLSQDAAKVSNVIAKQPPDPEERAFSFLPTEQVTRDTLLKEVNRAVSHMRLTGSTDLSAALHSMSEQQEPEAILKAIRGAVASTNIREGISSALHRANEMLSLLAEHPESLADVLPLSAHGTMTVTGSVEATLPALTSKITVYTPTVEIFNRDGTVSLAPPAESAPMGRPGGGLSRKHKRLLIQAQIFMVVFIALSGVVSANEDLADKAGPYFGGSALAAALWCATAVGKAFDKLSPPTTKTRKDNWFCRRAATAFVGRL